VVRARYDQFAKRLLDKALSMVGEVRTQLEIHGEVQAADVWFLPRGGHEAERVRLGLLGRMAETACLLEPFHDTPGGDAVLDCLNKQLTLRRNLVREARKDARTDDRRPPDLPRLWILSAGRPESVLAGLCCSPLADWPTGVWQAPSLLATSLVVLRDLPETRDTLPLRLMGSGAALERAIAELDALPAKEWEPRAFIPLLLAFRLRVPQDSIDPAHNDEDDMGYAERMEAIYAKWERRIEERGEKKGMRKGMRKGVKKGMEKGKEEGLRTALVNVYQARFGALPAALQTVIEATEDAPTLQGWTTLFSTATADEIVAALLPAGQRSGAPRRANKTGKARRDAGRARDRNRISRSARPSK
jgi:hypothetical protein